MTIKKKITAITRTTIPTIILYNEYTLSILKDKIWSIPRAK
jgi:hypothetical protein